MDRLSNNDISHIDRVVAADVAHLKHGSVEQREMVKRMRDGHRHAAWVEGQYAVDTTEDTWRDTAEISRVYANRTQILLDELNEEVRGVHRKL